MITQRQPLPVLSRVRRAIRYKAQAGEAGGGPRNQGAPGRAGEGGADAPTKLWRKPVGLGEALWASASALVMLPKAVSSPRADFERGGLEGLRGAFLPVSSPQLLPNGRQLSSRRFWPQSSPQRVPLNRGLTIKRASAPIQRVLALTTRRCCC